MNLQQVTSFLTTERSPTPEVISFRTTRRAVGWLGVSLPFVLWWGGALVGDTTLQPSISRIHFNIFTPLHTAQLVRWHGKKAGVRWQVGRSIFLPSLFAYFFGNEKSMSHPARGLIKLKSIT